MNVIITFYWWTWVDGQCCAINGSITDAGFRAWHFYQSSNADDIYTYILNTLRLKTIRPNLSL